LFRAPRKKKQKQKQKGKSTKTKKQKKKEKKKWNNKGVIEATDTHSPCLSKLIFS
jgi:hypothetical protein